VTYTQAGTTHAEREFEKAKAAYLKKDYPKAENLFRALLKDTPDLLFGHLYLGHSLFYQSKYKEAIPEYERAAEIGAKRGDMNQDDERLLTDQLGMAYGLSGRLDDAKSLFEAGIRKDPEYALYYYNLACAYAELGHVDEALSNLKLGFARRKHMLPGEEYPNPRTDDSFKRFLSDAKFDAALKEMGF
jgi:predicted Zn-dependent protease